MANSRKIIKVFLASPGDLQDERVAAKAVVEEFNATWADEYEYQLELIGWEDTVSTYGRPQEAINKDLRQCELFIGMMWKRWGTPPDTNGLYTSGFEEEFDLSLKSRKRNGRPEISLFFKDIPSDLAQDPGEELKKVIRFKERIIAEKKVLFETFADTKALEAKIRRRISKYIQSLKANDASTDEQRKRQTEPASSTTAAVAHHPFSQEDLQFLRGLVDNPQRDFEATPVSSVEVAQFRLLGNIISAQGNDQNVIGVHDANILYKERKDITLSQQEIFGLVDAGLENYSAENTPLWHWHASVNGFKENLLAHFSFSGTAAQKVGALMAMKLLSIPLPDAETIKRRPLLNSWLDNRAPDAVQVAALNYLGEMASTAEIPKIQEVLDRGDYATRNAATEALLRIHLKESREKALRAAIDLEVDTIGDSFLANLFAKPSSISDSTLVAAISHRNGALRLKSATALDERGSINSETATALLSDENAEVRLLALDRLALAGSEITDERARSLLVRKNKSGAFTTWLTTTSKGEEQYEEFQKRQLRRAKDETLKKKITADFLFDRTAYFVLAERHFSEHSAQLRRSVADQYAFEFSAHLKHHSRQSSVESGAIEYLKEHETTLRKRRTGEAIDILFRNGDPSDLPLARRVLETKFIELSMDGVAYLKRHGEWQDITVLLSAAESVRAESFGLLNPHIDAESRYQKIAEAVYAIGSNRLSDLYNLASNSPLLPRLIIQSSAATFRKLENPAILHLLNSQSSIVRKVASLKCVHSLSKKRLSDIFESYISREKLRYYNVIHWLDFGVSVPRNFSVAVAQKVLSDHWS